MLEPIALHYGVLHAFLLSFPDIFRCLRIIHDTLFWFFYHICYTKYFYILANKRYALASITICRIDAIAPMAANAVDATAMNVLPQNTRPRFEGLKVTL